MNYDNRELSRRLRFEALEDRRLLATITVDITADENDGISVGGVSLRDAIAAAAPGDTIDFAPSLTASGPATILLTHGELDINKSLTIDGPGANLLAIDASGSDPTPTEKNGDGSRVFSVFYNVGGVAFNGLKLTGGDVEYYGGAIENNGILTITSCIVANSFSGGGGGGIGSYSYGELSVIDSEIVDNESGFNGAGIYNSGTLTVENSRITGNTAGGVAHGGGIYANGNYGGGDVTISGSTISGNTAGIGGGIAAEWGLVSITLADSLIASNSAVVGGGLFLRYANLNAVQTTVSGNSASANSGGVHLVDTSSTISFSTVAGNFGQGFGGGITIVGGSLTLDHSIVAGNYGLPHGDDITKLFDAALTATYNLIGDNEGSGLTEAPVGSPDANGNLIGGSVHGVIDPKLGQLASNGGKTQTLSIAADSPALDAGDPMAVAGTGPTPQYDQRGTPYTRVAGGRLDIGAFERQFLTGLNFVVDTIVDEDDGNYSAGDFSLREAIRLANERAFSNDTITFAPLLTAAGPVSIVLNSGELKVHDWLTINGPRAHLLAIDATGNDPTPTENNGDGSRVLFIQGNSSFDYIDVDVNGVTITGGDLGLEIIHHGGAGVYSSWTNLSVTNATVTDNSAYYGGGGISTSGSLNITGSVISNNHGGGVSSRGSLVVSASTITGNLSSLSGGGGLLIKYGGATIENSTIRSNVASGHGGAIRTESATVAIVSSTIAGNSADGDGGGVYVDYASNVTMDTTSLTNNTARDGGGAFVQGVGGQLTLVKSIVRDNFATSGGGIATYGNSLVINESIVSDNTATSRGGGISASADSVVIDRSTISNNSVTGPGSFRPGGGLYVKDATLGFPSQVKISDTTISGNSSGYGGGIFADSIDSIEIVNSTISANATTFFGGGIYNTYGTMAVHSSTVTANLAQYGYLGWGAGIYSPGLAAATSTQLHSTIVAGNQFNDDVAGSSGFQHTFFSLGYNLIGSGNAVGAFLNVGDQTGVTNPLLGPLADNGGPTKTHAPLVGSPAINMGDPSALAGSGGVPLNDQRTDGFMRVYGGRIDIGSLESQPVPSQAFGDYNQNGLIEAADYVVWRKVIGTTGIPAHSSADGSGDGSVGEEDYLIWRTRFGTSPPLGAASSAAVPSFPEPTFDVDVPIAATATKNPATPLEADADTADNIAFATLDTRLTRLNEFTRPLERRNVFPLAKSVSNHLLLALALDHVERKSSHDLSVFEDRQSDDHPGDDLDFPCATDGRPELDLEWR